MKVKLVYGFFSMLPLLLTMMLALYVRFLLTFMVSKMTIFIRYLNMKDTFPPCQYSDYSKMNSKPQPFFTQSVSMCLLLLVWFM